MELVLSCDGSIYQSIYHYIFTSKFSSHEFLLTMCGHIINKPVYLVLDDLNLIDDLGVIIDFYRKIDKQGNIFMLEVPGNKPHNICGHTKWYYSYCIDCCAYYCYNCKNVHSEHLTERCDFDNDFLNSCTTCYKVTHEPLFVSNDGEKICYKCSHGKDSIFYSKAVISGFNLYEWIPIHKYTHKRTHEHILQNRNPNSHLYMRKLNIEYKDESIKLRLIPNETITINHLLQLSDLPLQVNNNIKSFVSALSVQ
jgi:hypothetical protein